MCAAHFPGEVGKRYVSLETPSWSRSNHHAKRVTGLIFTEMIYVAMWHILCMTNLYSVIYLSCNVSGNGLAVQKAWQYCCRQHQSSNPPNGSSDGGGSTSLLNALLLVWFIDRFIFNLAIGNCSFPVALKAQRKNISSDARVDIWQVTQLNFSSSSPTSAQPAASRHSGVEALDPPWDAGGCYPHRELQWPGFLLANRLVSIISKGHITWLD